MVGDVTRKGTCSIASIVNMMPWSRFNILIIPFEEQVPFKVMIDFDRCLWSRS